MDNHEEASFDGSRLREIRESRGFSRQQLAAQTVPPLSRTYIHLLEGDRKSATNPRRPSFDVIRRLANALDVAPTAFASSGVTSEAPPRRKFPTGLAEAVARFGIPEADAIELSHLSFRDRHPRSARDWADIWLALLGAIGSELP
jgi:transcriptional regulator with XRE-family HTH domain